MSADRRRKVLIRVDFVARSREIESQMIVNRAALPTIQYALAEGAACILVSHLGRLRKADPKYSLVRG